MNLGRHQLLAEALPSERPSQTRDVPRHGFRLGQSDAKSLGLGRRKGQWGQSDSSASRASHPKFSIPLSQSTQKMLARPQSASRSGAGQSVSNAKLTWHPTASKSDSRTDSQKDAAWLSTSGGFGGLGVAHDPRFPSQLHRDIHQMSARKAHKALDTIWARRHDENPSDRPQRGHAPNKYMLPHSMPGIHHPDKSVRDRAWKMQAQAQANALGDSYTSKKNGKRSSPKVLVKVLQHRKTGARFTSTSFPNRPSERHPEHDVVHSAISEMLVRSALLIEGMPNLKITRPPSGTRMSSIADLEAKLRTMTGEGASRIRQAIHFKKQLAATKNWGSPSTGGSTTADVPAKTKEPATSPTQDAALKTRQADHPGARTQVITSRPAPRPKGFETQRLPSPTQVTPTRVLPTPKLLPLEKQSRRGDRTQQMTHARMPSAKLESRLVRSTLLSELVANTFLSKFPPGSSYLGATGPTHDRAQTTAKLGLVTQQGGVNPGNKHRKEHDKKIKKLTKCYDQAGRDRVSQELCDTQPTKVGGVLDGIAMLKRTRLGG